MERLKSALRRIVQYIDRTIKIWGNAGRHSLFLRRNYSIFHPQNPPVRIALRRRGIMFNKMKNKYCRFSENTTARCGVKYFFSDRQEMNGRVFY